MPQVSRRVIDDFLAHKRLAVVGVSRDRRHFSRSVVRALRERGYEVIPVNPQTGEIDGLPCVPRVQAIGLPSRAPSS